MKFWTGKKKNTEKLKLHLNETIIPLVKHTKFLGVTIDENLNWTEHINNIISKLSVNKNLIGRTRNMLMTMLRNAYITHTFTHISHTLT